MITQLCAMRCSRAVAIAWVLVLCVVPPRCALGTPPRPRLLAEFPIGKGDSPWVVRAVIRGEEYQMLIDTGTNITIFDAARPKAPGRLIGTLNMNSTNGLTPIKGLPLFEAPTIKIGSMKLTPPWGVTCIDLAFHGKLSGVNIDGVLGMDLLRHLIFTVDPDERRMRFVDIAGGNAGGRIAVAWAGQNKLHGLPLLTAVLADGRRQTFLVDTGCNADSLDGMYSGTLQLGTYDRLLAGGQIAALPSANGGTTYTVSGRYNSSRQAAAPLAIGPYRHKSLVFSCSPGPDSLGRGYFSRFCTTFDFPHDAIYLRPAKEFDRADFCDLSGLRIARKDSRVIVAWVLRGGPAALGGVVVGDVVSAIDGLEATNLRNLDIRETLSKSGRHTLDLEHDGAKKCVTLVLGANSAPDNGIIRLRIEREVTQPRGEN